MFYLSYYCVSIPLYLEKKLNFLVSLHPSPWCSFTIEHCLVLLNLGVLHKMNELYEQKNDQSRSGVSLMEVEGGHVDGELRISFSIYFF